MEAAWMEYADLPRQIAEAITELLNRDFQVPLYFASISPNGAMSMGYYEQAEDGEGLDCTIVATHDPEDIAAVPVRMMLVDPRGKSAQLVIDISGPSIVLN
jgi:hypothetical protein